MSKELEIDLEDFFTRSEANEGIELPLTLPDGTETNHSITVMSIDSDSYRESEMEMKRALYSLDEEDPVKRAKMADEFTSKMLASCIKSWTMKAPCNAANKLKFITESPANADRVQEMAQRRILFVKKKQGDSLKLLSDTSRSTDPQTQKSQGGKRTRKVS